MHKNHHYVSACHVKYFFNKEKKKIFLYDRDLKNFYTGNSPKRVFSELFGNTRVTEKGIDHEILENDLNINFENVFPKIKADIDAIIRDQHSITDKQIDSLYKLIEYGVIGESRNPIYKAKSDDQFKKAFDEIAKNSTPEVRNALSGFTRFLENQKYSNYIVYSEFSHLYALINGTRNLTGKTAEKLANSFGLEGWMLLNLNYKIPQSIQKSTKLHEFYANFKNVHEYFSETVDARKASSFIEKKLLKSDFLSVPKFIWEISIECSSNGHKYSSKQLSQILTYLVHKQIIKSEKRPIKLRTGKFGKRMVDVFWK